MVDPAGNPAGNVAVAVIVCGVAFTHCGEIVVLIGGSGAGLIVNVTGVRGRLLVQNPLFASA
jgi:hypothetical protein